jgi:hypothetical protein
VLARGTRMIRYKIIGDAGLHLHHYVGISPQT